ncbi:hypothetical protein NEE14_014980 [Parabacteroides sp. AD58]|uniref:Uncharacterized protein n=1 Tax=Parabacteroides absconsus TaxID=2951805 RepID=A0ABZ2IJP6_9BACT|nr:hypothetical protein [Parabacteroides sp. AD58]MCM6902135.1 hypothetical protein [Parabacteroides sp. AD58]
MRRIICLLFCLCNLSVWLGAQTAPLSAKMELFKDYCLRIRYGVASKNLDELVDCLKEYNAEEYNSSGGLFVYKGEKIGLTAFDRFSLLKDLSPGDIPLGQHLQFEPSYVDTLVSMDLQPVELEEASLLRSEFDCRYTQRAIAAHSKCTYCTKGSGPKELFVVAEADGMINLTVNDVRNNQVLKDVSSGGKPSAQVCWEMKNFGEYTIEVVNLSDKDISVIIVGN